MAFVLPSTSLFHCNNRYLRGVLSSRRGNWGVRSGGGSSSTPPRGDDSSKDEGDRELQETLVEMVVLQKQEQEVDEFVKEKAKFLTEIAESAQEEFEKIASRVNEKMDIAGSKVLEDIESDVSEIEKEMADARAQIEADEVEFEKYEREVVKARNRALFFKSLFQPITKRKKKASPQVQEEIKVEVEKVAAVTRKSAKSPGRRNVYLALALALALGIAEGITSGEPWQKVAVYAALLAFVLLQIKWENSEL